MSKKLVFHIGHGKTGTSSIQKYLMSHSKTEESDFLYPETTRDESDAHHRLFNATPDEYKSLYYEIENASQKNIVVSSESGLPNMRNFSERGDYKYQFFQALSNIADVYVVYYVRNHFEIIESAFLQYLQMNNSSLYDALNSGNSEMILSARKLLVKLYFNDDIKPQDWLKTAPTRQFDYSANLSEFWCDIYGRQSMLTKVYNKRVLAEGDIISDFKRLLPFGFASKESLLKSKAENITTVYNFFPRLFLIDEDVRTRIKNTFKKSAVDYAKSYLKDDEAELFLDGFD
ncbi:hypothetical protein JC525_18475 [Alteromonas sp. IB21]|uniref:hypothetical protein n=1 Tax=Alteromonas sp. IB21 TaxID=2779369 RepID=UPI0018E882C2|nr:hypothetical protein [Alteromonas sp. IB21]MBJ2130917.1 hypothetical protein [Alteromonas sp. IB21]